MQDGVANRTKKSCDFSPFALAHDYEVRSVFDNLLFNQMSWIALLNDAFATNPMRIQLHFSALLLYSWLSLCIAP